MTERDATIDRDAILGRDAILNGEAVATSAETIRLDADEFDVASENVRAGFDRWVGGLVRDGAGRIALVRNRWSDGWVLPGGDVESGETLREAVVREAREETGLTVRVERPLEVVEQTFVCEGDAVRGHFAVFEALAEESEFGDDLGVDETEIEDAAWFGEIPDDARDPDLLARHR